MKKLIIFLFVLAMTMPGFSQTRFYNLPEISSFLSIPSDSLIFLMGTPKEEVQGYLKILAHLTRLLKKEAFRASLLGAKSPAEVIGVFKKEEEITA